MEDTSNETHVKLLREQYLCPHFRILVIGRANAGKTTILEKVCGVTRGTKPFIYDKDGKELVASENHLTPSAQRGLHDIEHQITYPGCNFIFHDSRGFESGATEELEIAWKFIEKKSAETELKNQLHTIWYCIPMDSPRPILPTELEFFNKGTGNVPLVVVFTKFDGQIVNASVNFTDAENADEWEMAREYAESTFKTVYLPKVLHVKFPPKAYVRLEDMDLAEKNCFELSQQTADAIDDVDIHQLFISTQMNNLNLCVKSALQHVVANAYSWENVLISIFLKFPHFWVDRQEMSVKQLDEMHWFEQGKQGADKEIQRQRQDGKSDGVFQAFKEGFRFGQRRGQLGVGFSQFQHFADHICHELSSILGDQPVKKFTVTPIACRILVALVIISKLSFWIHKPFLHSIQEALDQCKRKDILQKLKTDITPASMPLDHADLVAFLYKQINDLNG